MQPGTNPSPHRDGAHHPSAPAGVAHRPDGQAKALERAARYRGFTHVVPGVTAACAVLLAAARDAGLSLAVLRTLIALLRLVPTHRWHDGKPVVWVSNRRLADLVDCSPRTVQRHLRILHEAGLVAVGWGPGNTRLPYRQDGGDTPGPVGIDLRPALVFATELAIRRQARLAALRACDAACDAANTEIVLARGPFIGASDAATTAAHRQRLDEPRRQVRAAARQAHRPTATVTAIEATTATVAALAAEAEAIRQALERKRAAPDDGGARDVDKAADDAAHLSSHRAKGVDQKTESTPVENHVRTIQGSGRTLGNGWGGAGEPDDPAGPLLLGRWLADHAGARPLTSGERVEHEIAARQLAKRQGVATGLFNTAAARHGVGLVVGAVFHVAALPARAGVRSPGGLLASLLRRPAGQLTPATFHRRPPADPELDAAAALGLGARLAPSHRPHWVVERWQATCRRKGEPIHDPRRCLEAFAAKLEREQGNRRWAA